MGNHPSLPGAKYHPPIPRGGLFIAEISSLGRGFQEMKDLKVSPKPWGLPPVYCHCKQVMNAPR